MIAERRVTHIARDARHPVAIAVRRAAGVAAVGGVQPGPGHFQLPVVSELLIEGQFQPLATGFSGVFIRGAPAAAGIHHDLVIGIGLEQCGAEQPVADAGFAAQFQGIAGGGFQRQIQPVLPAGAVGELVDGRRFEAAAR